jgi:rfaE bifunctional protein nucleotidyltransferase chain/domain
MKKLEIIHSKIFSLANSESKSNFSRKLAYWNFIDKKVVFTNGCFDLLHLGHLDYLAKAADQGNVLVVGLNSDVSVKKIKGNNRPITSEKSRSHILAALHFIDAVILFDEETPLELIKMVKPDILVKGKDYHAEEIVGYDIVTKKGGEVITLDIVEGYSTSGIVQKILQQNNT